MEDIAEINAILNSLTTNSPRSRRPKTLEPIRESIGESSSSHSVNTPDDKFDVDKLSDDSQTSEEIETQTISISR